MKTHLADVKDNTYRVDGKLLVGQDESIKEIIAPYKAELDEKMSVVLGTFAKTLTKQKPESTLGNFITDIMRDYGWRTTGKTVDFAFHNYGGIRIGNIPKGPVRTEKIYELIPFENTLVVLKMSGKDVMQFLDHIAPSRGWPVSSGITFSIKENKPQDVLINGEPLSMEKFYHVAYPDYIANGGDNCFFLKDLERYEYGMLVRDCVIKHILALSSVGQEADANLENRITIIE
ncbi:MAG: 5'-nucleotidase [Bacteroidota bacterium]